MNAICLVLDRLHLGYLGCYGNSWIETPAFDRLASQALVFDQALIDSPDLGRLYRGYGYGLHALCARSALAERPSLPASLRAAGVSSMLLTDDKTVAGHKLASDFDTVTEIDPAWQPRPAEQVEQTHLAKCFVEAIEGLEAARDPFLFWGHFAGMGAIWDAPPEFRHAYRESTDPEPYLAADVPDRALADDFDPDDVWSVCQAYAAQISVLDTCLGAFLEFLDSSGLARQTLLLVTASRGLFLGAHRRIGACDDALYGELVHVPLLLRFPDDCRESLRSSALVEPADVWASLLDFWSLPAAAKSPTAVSLLPLAAEETSCLRDRVCISGRSSQRAIRTPAWYLRTASPPELFAKPDDRWEINNVAVRCQEIVECLEDALVEFDQTVQYGQASDLPPLGDVLVNGLG